MRAAARKEGQATRIDASQKRPARTFVTPNSGFLAELFQDLVLTELLQDLVLTELLQELILAELLSDGADYLASSLQIPCAATHRYVISALPRRIYHLSALPR